MSSADATPLRKTELFDSHVQAHARMVPFGGWHMPVSYSTVLTEHKAVREACGLFDVSHMGEVFVTGQNAAAFLQKVTINDISRLQDGQGQYSALLLPTGGMVDDVIIYRLDGQRFLICVNASNATKDFDWLRSQAQGVSNVALVNASSEWSQLAVQGPKSRSAVEPMIALADREAFGAMDYMSILSVKFFGHTAFIARTGYTGEWGYELYVPNAIATHCWTALMETAATSGIVPVGLGARDTLRLEACYLLYGNDMNETVSPLEAGIGWVVRLDKGDFIGRDVLVAQKAAGLGRQLFAFKMEDDGIARQGMAVFCQDGSGEALGVVTSGSVLPTVGGAGGLMLIDPRRAKIGDLVSVDVRGKKKLARLVKKPLYSGKVKG